MMEESDTYLAILEEGEAKGIKRAILRAGEGRLGAPGISAKRQLDGIADLERLDRMLDRALSAPSWEEIVGTPYPRAFFIELHQCPSSADTQT